MFLVPPADNEGGGSVMQYSTKKPVCPKCGKTLFGVARLSILSIAAQPLVIVCNSCGTVIGVLPDKILEGKTV
jgi:RNase P subunit RPR2